MYKYGRGNTAWCPGAVLFAMLSLILVGLLLIFLFTDVWYAIRTLVILLPVFLRRKKAVLTIDDIHKPQRLRGIVLPSDLDINMHMNNSRYLRECDFGRVHIWFVSGFYQAMRKLKGYVVVSAINVRYRRSLVLFQRYEVQTKFLCWEGDAMYLEQRIVTRDGFIAAIAYVKGVVRGTKMEDIFAELFKDKVVTSPPPPPEIVAWQESISLSSQKLRQMNSTAYSD